MAACDLDKYPEGSTMTQDQKDEVISMIPERIESELNGLKSGLNVLGTLGNPNSTGYHFDYGFPAICMIYDQAGQDMTCKNDAIGYNKYISQQKFRDRITTSVFNEFIWKNYYNHLKTANDCIATLSAAFPEDKRTAKVKNYFGQALASRAFDYLQLIQTYQFTYIGHESAKGVPLVLDTMTDDEKLNNPRATVEQVYTQIMSDLNTAISYLAENPVTRKDKAQITAEVAYGLRARTNLLMGNWAAAASDAAKACAGARPYSMDVYEAGNRDLRRAERARERREYRKDHGQRHAGRVCHPCTGGTGRKDLLAERCPCAGSRQRHRGHQAGAGAHRTHPCGHDRDLPQ